MYIGDRERQKERWKKVVIFLNRFIKLSYSVSYDNVFIYKKFAQKCIFEHSVRTDVRSV
jgi:hypothetical protein